ncbi:hypothetical protein [Streptomyces sp. NEAU-S7GS2]|uniref:hypothetical protein n=1 Tax=Streptomyces sp. NEAU-S7GS2 TaxID=2202000 RepID=UPI001EF3E241|nr:hypothetical protein [Streptomyces sp. NEAU-S7GS2]
MPAGRMVGGQVDDHHAGGTCVGEQAGQVLGAVAADGLPVGHDDGRPQAGGMLDGADSAVEDVPASQGAVVGGLDDGSVEEGVLGGQADLEQVGTRLRELVEVPPLCGCRMQAGGDEYAQCATGLGEEGVEGIGGGQGGAFPGGVLSPKVSGGVRPVESGERVCRRSVRGCGAVAGRAARARREGC